MESPKIKISASVIWISSIFLGVLSSIPQLASHNFNLMEALVNAGITSAFAVAMWYLNIYLLRRETDKKKRQGISYTKLLITLLCGLVVMFILAWIQQLILSHINFGPVMLMVEVRGILINLVFYMFLNLLQNNYTSQQVALELQQTKGDNLGAQYELLKQQINPHFLFNSLNTLKAMAETHDKETVDFIIKLSDFYRFTLESRKLDLIKVNEEMRIVNAYLFLQKARFGSGFTFSNLLEGPILQTLVPPFTLQLLVENCIKHNTLSREEPLEIKLYTRDAQIIVENPIRRKIHMGQSLGVGLSNINLRYLHLLNQQIEISENKQVFQIKLPIIYEYHHH